ncbi:MAG TPA: aldo/keto reductase [Usitatibacter sp.]|nr:aldo/keto reductase [Usitatibacter sp.]
MDRRGALRFLGTAGLLAAADARGQVASLPQARAVPSSGEKIPVVGLGTWITFDVGGGDSPARRVRGDILRAFFAAGGRLVDSSPMYGSSEEVIGAELARAPSAMLFSATKVWTVGALAGRRQMEHSLGLWKLPRFDLMQVHNLLDWESHWPTLKAMKAEGRVRHIGMTTSHGRRHDDLERILRRDRMDFVQVSYNMNDRDVERVLLPLAAERGTAVIVNRPFDGGELFGAKTAKPLPGWAKELQCSTWAEAFLRWIAAHPAVTCAIPATSKPAHLQENMRALAGPLPDASLRARMLADYQRA